MFNDIYSTYYMTSYNAPCQHSYLSLLFFFILLYTVRRFVHNVKSNIDTLMLQLKWTLQSMHFVSLTTSDTSLEKSTALFETETLKRSQIKIKLHRMKKAVHQCVALTVSSVSRSHFRQYQFPHNYSTTS